MQIYKYMGRCLIGSCLFFLGLTALSLTAEAGFVYDDHGKRDPLWPLVTTEGVIRYYDTKIGVEDMRLEGVMLGSENLAIINGKVMKVNDTISGFKLVTIENDRVILNKEDKTFVLQLKKGE